MEGAGHVYERGIYYCITGLNLYCPIPYNTFWGGSLRVEREPL